MKTTIELAREAGADTLMYWDIEKLKRFESLVRADEREAMLHLALLHAAPWHFQEAIRNRGNT